MIIDRIENASRYYPLGTGIAKALEYIRDNDLSSISTGSYEIVMDKVRMLVFEYWQKCTDQVRMEAHRKNIDVQYWISGSELMGYSPLRTQSLVEPFNEEKDFGIYSAEASFSKLEPGMFAIYFPTDLHTAVTDEHCKTMIRKIVFKITIE